MIPSECGAIAPVATRSASSSVEWMIRPPAAVSSRSRTRPNSRSWASGLERYSRREMSDSGAPASTSAADDGQRPRRRVRVGEGRRVHDDAGHQLGGQRAVAVGQRRAEPGREQRRPSRRSPRWPGSIQSASPAASFEAWWSMTTRGSRSNSSGWRSADRPDPIERAAVGHDEQVVVEAGIRVGPGPRDAGQEVVERRHRIGEDRRRDRRRRARRGGRSRASPRACRRRGSRGRPRGRGGPRVEPVDDGVRDGRRATASRSIIGGACPARSGSSGESAPERPARLAAPRRAFALAGRVAPARSAAAPPRPSVIGRSVGQQRSSASAGSRPSGGSSVRHVAGLELVEQVEDPRPALERSRRARGGTPGSACSRSRLPSSCRTNGIARPIAAIVAVRSLGLADHADRDLGVAQVRRRLDAGDRGEPDPRVVDLAGQDRADLLRGAARRSDPSAAVIGSLRADRRRSARRGRADTVCGVKHSMMSPSSRSL